MKKRLILLISLLIIISLLLTSCSLFPSDIGSEVSSEDLLGEWEFISNENGSADLAHDIEFLSDGALRITEDVDVLVSEYQYKVTKPGKMTVSALGVEREVKYEISGEQLTLNFDKGYNLYTWTGVPRATEDISLSIERTPTAIDLDIPEEIETPEGIKIGREVITPENAHKIEEISKIGKGMLTDVDWSPDGESIVVSSSIGIYIFDSQKLDQKLFLKTENFIFDVMFSPDGRLLTTIDSEGVIQIWDAIKWEPQRILIKDTRILCVTFSPDGSTLAVGSVDGTIRLLDSSSGDLMRVLKEHTGSVNSVVFSPEGKLMVSAGPDSVRLWDAVSGELLLVLEGDGPSDGVASIAFSPDGHTLAAAGYQGKAHLWDTRYGRLQRIFGSDWKIAGIDFSPNGGILASGGIDGVIRLWNPESGDELGLLEGHTEVSLGVAFSPDGHMLASWSPLDGTVRLWDISKAEEKQMIEGFSYPVVSFTYSPDGGMLATGDDRGYVHLWDLGTGEKLPVILKVSASWVETVAFSPDGETLITYCAGYGALLYDTENSELIHQYGNCDVKSVAISPDGGILATGCDDGAVHLFNMDNNEELRVLEGHTGRVYKVAFSPDGRTLASGDDEGVVYLWDLESGEMKLIFEGTIEKFSPNARIIVSRAGGHKVILFDSDNGELLRVLEGNEGNFLGIDISPDGKTLATIGIDAVRLWKTENGELLHVLEWEEHNSDGNFPVGVSFSPDGRTLASGNEDGIIHLWGIP